MNKCTETITTGRNAGYICGRRAAFVITLNGAAVCATHKRQLESYEIAVSAA